jgi:hypothetical protein
LEAVERAPDLVPKLVHRSLLPSCAVVERIELKVWKAELRSKPPGKVCLSCAAVSYDTEATAHVFILPSTTRRAR